MDAGKIEGGTGWTDCLDGRRPRRRPGGGLETCRGPLPRRRQADKAPPVMAGVRSRVAIRDSEVECEEFLAILLRSAIELKELRVMKFAIPLFLAFTLLITLAFAIFPVRFFDWLSSVYGRDMNPGRTPPNTLRWIGIIQSIFVLGLLVIW